MTGLKTARALALSSAAVLAFGMATLPSAPSAYAVDENSIFKTFIGKNGEDLPLREGNSDFGKRHIEVRGHLIGTWDSFSSRIDTALDASCYYDPKGDKTTCTDVQIDSPSFVVVFTEREAPDDRPVGIITAYEVDPGCRSGAHDDLARHAQALCP